MRALYELLGGRQCARDIDFCRPLLGAGRDLPTAILAPALVQEVLPAGRPERRSDKVTGDPKLHIAPRAGGGQLAFRAAEGGEQHFPVTPAGRREVLQLKPRAAFAQLA